MAELWAAGVRGTRARRRLGVEGGAARARRSCSSCARAGGCRSTRRRSTGSRSRSARSSSSTRCSRSTGSAAARPTAASLLGVRHDLAAGRRLLLRPRARADARASCGGSARRSSRPPPASRRSGWSTSTRSRSRGGATRARPAGSTSQLGFDYQRALGAAGELRLQHGQRAPAAAARLDVPLAARELVHARRRAAARRGVARPAAGRRSCLWLAARRRSLFAGLLWTHSRSSYLALALGLVVVRVRSAAVRAVALARRGGRRRRRRPGVRQGLPAHRARRRASRPASSPTSAATRTGAGGGRPAAGSRTRAPRATGGACATGSRRCSATRRASGSGTPARRRRAPASTIKAGESTYTELGVDTGLLGALALRRVVAALLLARRCCRARPGSARRSSRCSRSACRPT